jgi:Glycosyl transferase family 90
LFSNSVVMTQTPTKTSWAMEELLQPWVHYIPLSENLSDVAEKMQWVVDNDEAAQRIATNGQLWIRDLVFHPDADSDEEVIFNDIVRRYSVHFRYNPSLFPGHSLVEDI